MEEFKFSTIEEAVADLRAGKMIIAVDETRGI
jgi:3,4-dihydroxy 2-butanone 4-phosphate synthase/GTP cyclohydrolase II